MIDVLLVKYCPLPAHEVAFDRTEAALTATGLNVLVRDNTNDNIGLSRARNELLKQSKADVVIAMDFDLTWGVMDFDTMAESALEPTVGIVTPTTVGFHQECTTWWSEIERCACNCMVMARDKLTDIGGFDERYFVAYADWDLLNRIEATGLFLLQHNGSLIDHHEGLSKDLPEKQTIWAKDRAVYNEIWGDKRWN